jgi:phosphoribosyl-AMP cyclohydrolase
MMTTLTFASAPTTQEREEGRVFAPKFDRDGLITAVAVDATTRDVLMVAHMNHEALAKTLETRQAWYWSRSRKTLWLKGETSGQIQTVKDMRVDCDQDCILLIVEVAGNGGCCHTGRQNCFYRRIDHIDADGSVTLAPILPNPH